MIKQDGNKWVLWTKDGSKKLGTFDTKEEAVKREGQVEYFKHRESCREVMQITESFVETTGQVPVTVIVPGMNKSGNRMYPAETLRRDYKIFEGAKMFLNHQTDRQTRERPEGSVNDYVANLKNVHVESDGRVKGTAVVIDPQFKAKLVEMQKQGLLNEMGVSIRAVGEARESVVQGKRTNVVESLLKCRSVDFVTYAGAGGQVEAIESDVDAEDIELISIESLREKRPDLVLLIEAQKEQSVMDEAQVKKLQEDLAAATARATKAEADLKEANDAKAKQQKIAEAQPAIAKLVNESKLPQVAKDKLLAQFKESDSDKGVKEAIDAETEYLKKVAGGKVTNMGESKNDDEPKDEKKIQEALVESFKSAGMTEEQAKIAAGVR